MTDGAQLLSRTTCGAACLPSAAQEAADVGLTNWGVFEWSEPDQAIEAAFAPYDADGNPRTVTASVVDGALRFEYGAIETADDPFEIIDILTGEESNG